MPAQVRMVLASSFLSTAMHSDIILVCIALIRSDARQYGSSAVKGLFEYRIRSTFLRVL